MSIEQEVRDIVKKKEDEYKNKESFARFVDHYQEMVKRGLIKKNQYELPPTDTIGTRRYQTDDAE
ncbi:MAG: hypothetical protein ABR936_10330 [Bacteroidota bacterium]|jgi:ribosomal protein S20